MTTTHSLMGSFFSECPAPLKRLSYTRPQPEEAKEVHVIKDHRGRSYQVDIHRDELADGEARLFFFVQDGGHNAAKSIAKACGTRLTLCDFLVRDDVPKAETWLNRFVRGMLGRARPVFSYRRRGLATAFVKFIIAWAEKQGIKEIKGSLSPHDLRSFPGLKALYEQNGFTVRPGGDFGAGELRLGLRGA